MDKYSVGAGALAFLVDLLLLRLAGDGDRGPIAAARSVFAAAIGGIYCFGCTIPGLYFLGNPLFCAMCLGLMSALAFGIRPTGLKRSAVFCFLWLTLSGLAAGVEEQSTWFLVLAGALVCMLLLIETDDGAGKSLVHIRIRHGGKTADLTALADNGNLLCDPVSGEHVLIVSPQVGSDLLGLTPKEMKDPVTTAASGKVSGLRLIPYSAVGREKGLLIAVRFADVTVDGKHQPRIVAFSPNPIGDGHSFEALAGGIS